MDISGLKSMMKDGQRAVVALDAFYRSGYSVLNEYRHERPNQQSNVHGFFISDCAVLFVTDPARERCNSLRGDMSHSSTNP